MSEEAFTLITHSEVFDQATGASIPQHFRRASHETGFFLSFFPPKNTTSSKGSVGGLFNQGTRIQARYY